MPASAWTAAASARSRTSDRPTGRSSTACAINGPQTLSVGDTIEVGGTTLVVRELPIPASERSLKAVPPQPTSPPGTAAASAPTSQATPLASSGRSGPRLGLRRARRRARRPARRPRPRPRSTVRSGPATLSLRLHIDFAARKATVAVDDGSEPAAARVRRRRLAPRFVVLITRRSAAERRLQQPVAAAVEHQRRAVLARRDLEHLADEDQVVAGFVRGVQRGSPGTRPRPRGSASRWRRSGAAPRGTRRARAAGRARRSSATAAPARWLRMLTANTPLRLMCSAPSEGLITHTSISGGSSDTEENAFAVMP